MLNIQDIKKKTNDNNRYLTFRFIVYLLITMFLVESLYSTEGISDTLYFNNILLYGAPLIGEYFWGNRCYSNVAKFFKTTGFILSLIIGAFGVFGVFRGITIQLIDNNSIIEGIYLNKWNLLPVIRILPFLCVINTFLDLIFSYGQEDLVFYEITETANNYIEELIKEKRHNILEEEKEKYVKAYQRKILDVINN